MYNYAKFINSLKSALSDIAIMFEMTHTIIFLLGIILAISSYLFWYFYKHFQYWKRRNIPHLIPIIPFGNTLNIYIGKETIGECFSNAYLDFKKQGVKHGGFYYFQQPVYIPVDSEIIRKIMISDADNFSNHGMYVNPKDDPFSEHLFNMEDGKWRTVRSKTPASFTSAKMRKMFLMMMKLTEPLTDILDSYAENATPLDIKTVTTRFTTDIISVCAFGVESNTLKYENEELLQHGRQFFDYQWTLFRNTLVFTIPHNILKKFKFRIFPKATEVYITDMFRNILEFRKSNDSKRDDIADTLIRLTERHEDQKDFSGKHVLEPLEVTECAAHMFVFFAGGFETSSSAQTFALFELATNFECQDKLRMEIKTVLERHDNKLSYDAIMEMKYLDNVVDEILRKYPIFPILPRVCKEDYPIAGTDFTLEKGTFVMVSNMGIQRDPEYYPNPEKFDPDRFNNENKRTRPHIANMPFGEGPRICIGKRFGLLQTKLGLLTIIKNYEVTLNEKTTKDFKFVSNELILRKNGNIWINLKKITE